MPSAIMQPYDGVLWSLPIQEPKQLKQSLDVDVVVVGGGMAGLSAAQSFRDKGHSVVLLEKSFCGAGASGKSSGFITPDSEISLADLVDRYGESEARRLWDFVLQGVLLIKNNIEKNDIACNYRVEDTLVLASSARAFDNDVKKEHEIRKQLGFSSTLIEKNSLDLVTGARGFFGGVSYPDSFGINGFAYCQGMRNVLIKSGVDIYEDTPVMLVDDNKVTTPYGHVRARYIILCTDRFTPDLGRLTYEIYHFQTFLAVSNPLTDAQVNAIFPERSFMAWDTDLIYHYFRLSIDNRLMVGGASLLSTYAKKAQYGNSRICGKLEEYVRSRFPDISMRLSYMWPGLLGITKDIMPIAGQDKKQQSVYYIAGAAGLPWAAALGRYSADSLLNNNHEFDRYLSPYRQFPIGRGLQKILGTPLTFALSNFSVVGTL